MKVLVQRVLSSSVEVDNKIVGQINKGLMLLVGFTDSDTDKEIDYMVDKIINLRIPSYIKALSGDKAILLYDKFNNKLKEENIKVETGIFGADMKVSLINDGPITIMLEK